MSHAHSSKIKFRPPLPDSFVGKMANQKKNDLEGVGKEGVRESAIWVSSMVSSSLMWSNSVISQCSIEKLSTMPRRQSICELEGDSVVDDILNEKNKIFTSFSQSKCEVKMVQSLVSIWEEFERYGVQEMTKRLELTQPHPEYVLEKFVRGLQYDNLLSDSLATMHESFPENALASDSGEKLKVHIESQTRTDVYGTSKQCQNRSTVLGEFTDNHEGNNTSNMSHCLPSDDKEDILLHAKVSDAHELRTGKKISFSSEEEVFLILLCPPHAFIFACASFIFLSTVSRLHPVPVRAAFRRERRPSLFALPSAASVADRTLQRRDIQRARRLSIPDSAAFRREQRPAPSAAFRRDQRPAPSAAFRRLIFPFRCAFGNSCWVCFFASGVKAWKLLPSSCLSFHQITKKEKPESGRKAFKKFQIFGYFRILAVINKQSFPADTF
ncbi:uncharacterized protein LOC141826323 [Curcuma longa]|uniref:uncharacterized protein LOC141826323 n=1 Tax=Curcuma longa TaxID=136217 RepID=UPI003D9F8C52